ncbi:unnamed protein product [Linum trigynum]|uniref:Retrotransposon Copia-like N-terminal domain-containing protein n=1 Tax=Linum trigynum TaxID=586398 RepID=A0AAV2EDP5_9ROSI
MTTESASVSSTSSSGDSASAPMPSVSLLANPQLTIKLTPTNYLLWHAQITPLLRCHQLMGHVDGTTPAPPLSVDGRPNPHYSTWYIRDQYVLTWINCSLSESVLPLVINKSTAYDAWSALSIIYASGSKLQVRHLTKELQNLRRGDASIHSYLQTAKGKADQLAVLGSPVANDDFIAWILDGLGEDYRPLVRHIESRLEPIRFEDLHSLLLSAESQIQRFSLRPDSPAPTAFYSSAGGFRGRGRASPRGHFVSNPPLLSDRSSSAVGPTRR